MIRDPSDGSVKEPAKVEAGIPVSGLPDAPAKSDELIRLEKSREWLKSYSGFSTSTE